MMSYDFVSTSHGKWILAGEHAVVRGGAALVFPLLHCQMDLSYQETGLDPELSFDREILTEIPPLFWKAIEQGMRFISHPKPITGHFHLKNAIPIGVGLGASAALSANISRWLVWRNHLPQTEVFFLAQKVEHLFHGTSSGLDIAGVLSKRGIYFTKEAFAPISQSFSPHWYLSFSGKGSPTSECIEKVKALWKQDPIKAQAIDDTMARAVLLSKEALQNSSVHLLGEAIQEACECFRAWGLVNDALDLHMQHLYAAGAIACKPTGSGNGGYVLSLWNDTPPQSTPPMLTL